MEGPEHKRVIYKRLRAVVEGFNGRVKSRLAYSRLTWQGLGNASIHVCLVLMVAYAVCIAAYGIGKPELRQRAWWLKIQVSFTLGPDSMSMGI